MKNIITILLIICTNYAYSQFTAASVIDINLGASSIGTIQPRTTGNDVIEVNGNTYSVCVWENAGTTSANLLGWDFNGTNNGLSSFGHTSLVRDPDVCLVVYDDTVYAVVAYASSGRLYWNALKWSGTGFGFVAVGSSNNFFNGFGTTINIDGSDHANGQFAIVWDKVGIRAAVGDIASMTLNSNVLIAATLLSNEPVNPDVSIYYDGSNNIVHVAYIGVNGNLIVDDHSYATLASGGSGSLSNVLSVSPQSGFDFHYPRIASPNGSNASTSEWTVVAEEEDGLSHYITGFNNGSTTPIYYNNGFYTSSADLTTELNYYVAVAYDSNYPSDGIWVGWNFDNLAGNLNYSGIREADYPIVLKCDNTAIPIVSNYWEAPTGLTTSNDDIVLFLSLAGRYTNDELFLTYIDYWLNGAQIDDIYIKNVTSVGSATSLRNSDSNQLITAIEAFGNDEIINLKLFDLKGSLILYRNGTKKDLLNYLKVDRLYLEPSLYLVKFISLDGRIFECKKIFIGN